MDTSLNSHRAPFQILVFHYRFEGQIPLYLILKRADAEYWQPVAGGGEGNENPRQAAIRETFEETGLRVENKLIPVPPAHFISVYSTFNKLLWGPHVTIIPQYTYGTEVSSCNVVLSEEHTEYVWMDYEQAIVSLYWTDNIAALKYLHHKIKHWFKNINYGESTFL